MDIPFNKSNMLEIWIVGMLEICWENNDLVSSSRMMLTLGGA